MYIVYRDMDMGIATSSHVNRENDDNPLEFWVFYFQTNPIDSWSMLEQQQAEVVLLLQQMLCLTRSEKRLRCH